MQYKLQRMYDYIFSKDLAQAVAKLWIIVRNDDRHAVVVVITLFAEMDTFSGIEFFLKCVLV